MSSRTAAGKNSKTQTADGQTTKTDANGPKDFFWTYTEEPHRTRRLEIIKKHPEVRPTTSYDATCSFALEPWLLANAKY